MAKPSTQLLLMQALKEIERLEAELARRDTEQRDRDWYTDDPLAQYVRYRGRMRVLKAR